MVVWLELKVNPITNSKLYFRSFLISIVHHASLCLSEIVSDKIGELKVTLDELLTY